jgi:plasmid stabilization system protein ParE
VKRYRFHPEARVEVQAAAAWYRERSREAARGFVDAVTDGTQSIRRHPEAWPTWRRVDVRRRVLRRYPYSIFYVIEGEVIVIVAVAHHKRRPGYWLPRLRG